MKKCEKWFWVELIGFDNSKRDFGVRDYLANAGFIPDLLSLLLSSPDFVHLHDTKIRDVAFPPDICSYGGRPPLQKGKKRQVWTKTELKRLIAGLHKHGIEVYFSVFDMFLNNAFHNEWVSEHRELLATRRDGLKISSINPLAKMEDGSYYEDFFVKKLIEVVKDYGFDGFHCADGYNHPRLPLYWSDYSDDMVGQFIESSGVKLPSHLSGECNDNKGLLEERADWIWRNRRVDWIRFFVKRWEEYCRKIVNRLHKENKKIIFNTSWTRDPFEAIYRYGIDYRKIADTGVDRFIQECPGAGNEIGVEGAVYPDFFYKIMATILLSKACMPHARIIALNHIHDVNENWEILRNVPTFLQREIYAYPNLFYRSSKNKLERCIEGFMACLADGINHEEWKWLQYNWDRGFAMAPLSISGLTLVWSDNAAENQLEDFMETRGATVHSILYRLLSKGFPVYCAADVNDINELQGPLLVINHHLFPKEELGKIFACKNGPVIIIGRKGRKLPKPDFQIEDIYPPGQLSMSVYGCDGLDKRVGMEIIKEEKEEIPGDIAGIEEPPIYCSDMYSRKISESFLTSCVKIISQMVSRVRVVNNVPVKLLMVEKAAGSVLLFIGNDEYGYAHPQIDIGKEIRSIGTITCFPYKPVEFAGSKFTVRVPGKGIVVLDILLK